MKRKIAACFLAVLMCLFIVPFVGCTTKPEREVDQSKTQLHIGVYNGGLGYEWVEKLSERFEELFSEYQGEGGKVGVQVWFDAQKEKFETASLQGMLDANATQNDIYLSTSDPKDFINKAEYTTDITDIVNEKVYAEDGNFPDEGEVATKSIADKLDKKQLDRYTFNGKIMGMPYNESIIGFVYDHDLFVENNYYDGGFGPDGIEGTYDDGLPATFEDLRNLFDQMVVDGITPFTFTGFYNFYFDSMYRNVQAQYDGYEQTDLLRTYDGYFNTSMDDSVNSANNGQGTKITPENGYLLVNRKGAKKAIEFVKFLFSDTSYYSQRAALNSQTHTQAQGEFINSIEATGSNKRIAMLWDGDWWENEAKGLFKEMATSFREPEYDYGQRDFRYMPLPKFEGQALDHGSFSTFQEIPIIFVNSKSQVKDIAGKWLQYMASNDGLSLFTEMTGSVMPYEFTLSKESYEKLTPFSQYRYTLQKEYSNHIYTPPKACDFSLYAKVSCAATSLPAKKTSELSYDYASPYSAFIDSQGLTADAYWRAYLNNYSVEDWTASYQNFMEVYG